MAKNWYPVIDILTCAECGTCVRFCPHGVMAFMTKKKPLYPLLSILPPVSTIVEGVRVNVLPGQSPMWAITAKQRAQRVAVVHVGSNADEHKKSTNYKNTCSVIDCGDYSCSLAD